MGILRSRARRAMGRRGVRLGSLVLAGAAALSTSVMALPAPAQAGLLGGGTSEYIVSAPSGTLGTVVNAVNGIGATVGNTLPIVNGVTSQLNSLEVTLLEAIPGIVVTPDLTVNVQGSIGPSGHDPSSVFTQQSGATQLWAQGDTGVGVNVAVLDTGIAALPDFAGRMVDGIDLSGEGNPWHDGYGHGTFVAGLIAGNGASSNGAYTGEAPGAGLVSVKVAGASGQTDLATVIAGVGWTVANQANDNIRVLNLSLGYLPVESTVLDPLDQAVEVAWQSGITVVASAGNSGPGNGTVLSPGDDPLVLTTGAVDDGAQADPAADTMTTFSSVGPDQPGRLVQAGPGQFGPLGREPPCTRLDRRRTEPVGACRQRQLRGLGHLVQLRHHKRCRRSPDRGGSVVRAEHRQGHTPGHHDARTCRQPLRGRPRRPQRRDRGQLRADDLEPAGAEPADPHRSDHRPRVGGSPWVVEPRQLDRLEVERLEVERLDVERLDLERLDLERLRLERFGLERLDLERIEVERLHLERLHLERLEVERIEVERVGLELIRAKLTVEAMRGSR